MSAACAMLGEDRQTEGPTEFFEKYLGTPKREALPWIFPLYFQLPYLPEETCFQEAGSSPVERTSHPLTISKK
jgi:hypothetical protein